MEQILEMNKKNEKITMGEVIVYKGEEIEVPGMTPEEIDAMVAEGEAIGNEVVTIDDEEIKLIDMENGSKVYKRLQAMKIEGNVQAFWYVWREHKIEKRLENLPESKRDAIKKLLGRK